MDDRELLSLETGNKNEVTAVLKHFVERHSKTFIFGELNENRKRRRLWSAIFQLVNDPKETTCHKDALSCIRILSREKFELNEIINDECLALLLRLGGLVTQEEVLTRINRPVTDYEVMLEAQKCLCNIIFNSPVAQALSCKNHTVEGVVMRMRTYWDPDIPADIKYFDMKILFLITALCPEVRPRLREELHGLTYLMETLDLVLKEASGEDYHYERGAACSDIHGILSDDHLALACEILKVLFNLTVQSGGNQHVDEEGEALFLRLVSILHDLLLCDTTSAEKQNELQSHTVNLLMSVPPQSYEQLLPAMQPIQPKALEVDGRSMQAADALLRFLDQQLNHFSQGARGQQELLSPILTVLGEGARTHRIMRKFLRQRILPPLKDVMQRPEQGTTLRNRLCCLLTSPNSQISGLVADLLFVLCKENVGRMVKYTGYGNAAGLLANRGLLLGSGGGHCSSDSEDSETDEYREYKNHINPVTGAYEPPRPDPMENMSEEQKEYATMQLINVMDKLSRGGIVQPCRVGEDGRPEPLGHVLQLLEGHGEPRQLNVDAASDSD